MNANVRPNTDSAPLLPLHSVRDFVVRSMHAVAPARGSDGPRDRYEMTAFAYRLIDRFGIEHAPAFMVDRVRIGGRWLEGPVVANPYGRWPDEALLFGVPEVTGDYRQMYHALIDALGRRLEPGGTWRRIPPVEVGAERAPCKEVVLRGDDIDIERFAWLKNNPADAGRINITSVITSDPEFGTNVGTYRCQVRDSGASA